MTVSTSVFSGRKPNAIISKPEYVWGEDITERLNDLVKLEEGWDGYDAKPVSFDNANFAMDILKEICDEDTPQPQIVPGVNGDLQIEWHAHEVDIELHIIRRYSVIFWTNDEITCPNGEEVHLDTNFTIVLPQIRKLTGGAEDATAAA